ncbi:hypothetical protein HDU84_005226 [Entophlyctis sp. JEL0112]|nr:hypothetical protein HDU84_005226 [Entophlyctis sp. JEL0112]
MEAAESEKAWAVHLPKTELHAHLNGSVSFADLRELALARGQSHLIPDDQQLAAILPGGSPAFAIGDCFALFSDLIYRLVDDVNSLTFVVEHVLAAFERDGCEKLELRSTPRETAFMTRREYTVTVVQAVSSYKGQMAVRLFLSLDRRHSPQIAEDIVDLVIEFNCLHPQIVIGVDVCGNPLVGGIRHLVPALLRVKEKHNLKLVIHFGEVQEPPEAGELETILALRPDRLGHCTFVPTSIMDEIIARGITIEICLSSNVLGGTVVEYDRHHLVHLWHERGYRKLALCTDDRGILRSELSDEYVIARKVLGIARSEMEAWARAVRDWMRNHIRRGGGNSGGQQSRAIVGRAVGGGAAPAVVDYAAMDADAGIAAPLASQNRSLALFAHAGRFAPLAADAAADGALQQQNQATRGRRANPYGMPRRAAPFQNMSLRNMSSQSPGAATGSASSSGVSNEVSILNWKSKNPDPGALFDFLKQKVDSTNLDIVSQYFDGDAIIIRFKTPSQASAVCGLSGIRYIGQKLLIRKQINITARASGTGSSDTFTITQQPGVVSLLSEVLKSRYDETSKFINLESLASDPRIQSNASLSGFGSDGVETGKIGPVVCKLIGQLFPDVQSINFASNNLSTLKPFQTLSVYCPFIQNISFDNNLLQGFKDVECLGGDKLKNLREIVFTRNPFHDREAKKGDASLTGYRTKIKAMFPSIKLLDMVGFEDEVALPEIGLPSVEDLPETEKGSFMDTDVTANLTQEFIPKLVTAAAIPALSALYTDNSHFSVSVNPTNRRHLKSHPANRQQNNQFDTWLANNRNHTSCKDPSKRLSLLAKGVSAIETLFSKLPQTKHPTNAAFDKFMFVADAFQQQMQDGSVVVILTVQGEFSEVQLNRSKAFTRTFVLIPAVPGSLAAQSGWKVAILNDMLVIRSWTHERTWAGKQVSPMSAHPTDGQPLIGLAHGARAIDGAAVANGSHNASVNGNSAGGVASALPSDLAVLSALKNHFQLDDAKHALVIQLAQATGLNYQFSAQCLNDLGWNRDSAFAAFNSARV